MKPELVASAVLYTSDTRFNTLQLAEVTLSFSSSLQRVKWGTAMMSTRGDGGISSVGSGLNTPAVAAPEIAGTTVDEALGMIGLTGESVGCWRTAQCSYVEVLDICDTFSYCMKQYLVVSVHEISFLHLHLCIFVTPLCFSSII